MRKLNLTTLAIAVGAFSLVALTSNASPLTLEIIVKDTGASANALLDHKDVISAGSKIRLAIRSDIAGDLSVGFKGPGRRLIKIVEKQNVSQGAMIYLPSRSGWYDLDNSNGEGFFEAEVNGSKSSARKKFDFFQSEVGYSFDKLASISPAQSSLRVAISDAEATAIKEKKSVRAVSVGAAAIQRLFNAKGVILRGGAGAKIFRKYAKSVVLIVTDEGIGSGALIDNQGTVVTNWHVIEGFNRVAVVFKPEIGEPVAKKDIVIGQVKFIDQVRDLAVIKLRAFPSDLTPIPLGKLREVEVGSDVHAIGHPTGESWTYTRGTISQVRADYKWSTSENTKHRATIIQTQTPINPGNSGGPLINDRGQIVGINSFVRKNADGLNYAVSIRDVRDFLSKRKDVYFEKNRNAQKECNPRKKTLDRNNNGKPDGAAIDTNCDGRTDMVVIDKDEDGREEFILLDTDHNGKIDTKVRRSNKKGPLDVWLFDKNEDQKWDIGGLDTDGDGKPDKFRKLT